MNVSLQQPLMQEGGTKPARGAVGERAHHRVMMMALLLLPVREYMITVPQHRARALALRDKRSVATCCMWSLGVRKQPSFRLLLPHNLPHIVPEAMP